MLFFYRLLPSLPWHLLRLYLPIVVCSYKKVNFCCYPFHWIKHVFFRWTKHSLCYLVSRFFNSYNNCGFVRDCLYFRSIFKCSAFLQILFHSLTASRKTKIAVKSIPFCNLSMRYFIKLFINYFVVFTYQCPEFLCGAWIP